MTPSRRPGLRRGPDHHHSHGHGHMHFECCGQLFHGRGPFLQHREEEHAGEPFTCGTCDAEFEELDAFIEHTTEAHGD